MAKTFPELLASVRQMLIGLQANAEKVAGKGATPTFTKNGKSMLETLEALEAEHDSMKAALKAKTAALDVTLSQIKTWQSEAQSAVKATYRDQPEKWVEFGIKPKTKKK